MRNNDVEPIINKEPRALVCPALNNAQEVQISSTCSAVPVLAIPADGDA